VVTGESDGGRRPQWREKEKRNSGRKKNWGGGADILLTLAYDFSSLKP
jgi:hypothetical protein